MSQTSFYQLTPDVVLESLEKIGFEPNGYLTQLNSYENRVFRVELENDKRIVAKFYRPGRWSRETILEEHEFIKDIK